MKKLTSTILLLFIYLLTFSRQANEVAGLKVIAPSQPIRLRCFTVKQEPPLYILDGVPVDSAVIRTLDANNIASIDILKSGKLSAVYGCRAVNGVVLITTKQSVIRFFEVLDATDGKPVSGATLSFISINNTPDTLQMAASELGLVQTCLLKPGHTYEVSISSAGYKPLHVDYQSASMGLQRFKLERDLRPCAGVTVVANLKTSHAGTGQSKSGP